MKILIILMLFNLACTANYLKKEVKDYNNGLKKEEKSEQLDIKIKK